MAKDDVYYWARQSGQVPVTVYSVKLVGAANPQPAPGPQDMTGPRVPKPAQPESKPFSFRERDAKIAAKFRKGVSKESLAFEFGITETRVLQIVRRANIPST
jgi:hypothetical protein